MELIHDRETAIINAKIAVLEADIIDNLRIPEVEAYDAMFARKSAACVDAIRAAYSALVKVKNIENEMKIAELRGENADLLYGDDLHEARIDDIIAQGVANAHNNVHKAFSENESGLPSRMKMKDLSSLPIASALHTSAGWVDADEYLKSQLKRQESLSNLKIARLECDRLEGKSGSNPEHAIAQIARIFRMGDD